MMELVNSKNKKLPMQEIITRVAIDQQNSAPMPLAGTLVSIVKELEMENSEAIQFGNTVFISHFDSTGKAAVMRALNADTGANLIDNCELYGRHMIQRGARYLITVYNTESFGAIFKRIEQKHLGQVLYGKTVYGDFEAHILLNAPNKKGKGNAQP